MIHTGSWVLEGL